MATVTFKAVAPVEAQALDPRETFCMAWPIAQMTLEALKAMSPGIPGIGWMVGLAVGIVLSGGNAAYQSLCGGAVSAQAKPV